MAAAFHRVSISLLAFGLAVAVAGLAGVVVVDCQGPQVRKNKINPPPSLLFSDAEARGPRGKSAGALREAGVRGVGQVPDAAPHGAARPLHGPCLVWSQLRRRHGGAQLRLARQSRLPMAAWAAADAVHGDPLANGGGDGIKATFSDSLGVGYVACVVLTNTVRRTRALEISVKHNFNGFTELLGVTQGGCSMLTCTPRPCGGQQVYVAKPGPLHSIGPRRAAARPSASCTNTCPELWGPPRLRALHAGCVRGLFRDHTATRVDPHRGDRILCSFDFSCHAALQPPVPMTHVPTRQLLLWRWFDDTALTWVFGSSFFYVRQ